MDIMQDNNVRQAIKYINRDDWREYSKNYKPLIDTERKLTPLEKHPKDLDFSKTIGNTTYVVKSHFNKNAGECLVGIVLRWIDNDTNISNLSL